MKTAATSSSVTQALEELLVNVLTHRDYFTSASIRIMVRSGQTQE